MYFRKFDGKRFELCASYWAKPGGRTKRQTRQVADNKATLLRKQGWYARVIVSDQKSGYVAYRVYRRRK